MTMKKEMRMSSKPKRKRNKELQAMEAPGEWLHLSTHHGSGGSAYTFSNPKKAKSHQGDYMKIAILISRVLLGLGFHIFMEGGQGIAPGLVFSVFEIFLIYAYRSYFRAIFTANALPT